MKNDKSNGAVGLDGCIIRDERGIALAILEELDGVVVVRKTTACSIGTYLYIITFLRDIGFEAR